MIGEKCSLWGTGPSLALRGGGGGGQEVHVEPCCDVHKVPAWVPLAGVSTPQRLGASVQWHMVAGSSEGHWTRGRKSALKLVPL